MLSLVSATLAGTNLEASCNNIRNDNSFNLKADWSAAGILADQDLALSYDYEANSDMLKDATLSGTLVDDDDMTVSYELTHTFSDSSTGVKLTAVTSGTTISADYDKDDGLGEISVARDVDLGDSTVSVDAGWLVSSKTARVKLMSKLGDDDSLTASFDYDVDGGSASGLELTLDHALESGKDVSATFTPDSKNLDVDYSDATLEDGATWTASASLPLEGDGNLLDSAKISVKRSWSM